MGGGGGSHEYARICRFRYFIYLYMKYIKMYDKNLKRHTPNIAFARKGRVLENGGGGGSCHEYARICSFVISLPISLVTFQPRLRKER